MLVLSRKTGEQVLIGEAIVVKVLAIHGRQVKIGIDAPADIAIRREELDWAIAGNIAAREAHPPIWPRQGQNRLTTTY